jgi:hypothetical protein
MSPTTRREQWPSLHRNGHRYWDVVSSGNWAEDCQVGVEYGRIYLERVKSGEPYLTLSWIVPATGRAHPTRCRPWALSRRPSISISAIAARTASDMGGASPRCTEKWP